MQYLLYLKGFSMNHMLFTLYIFIYLYLDINKFIFSLHMLLKYQICSHLTIIVELVSNEHSVLLT